MASVLGRPQADARGVTTSRMSGECRGRRQFTLPFLLIVYISQCISLAPTFPSASQFFPFYTYFTLCLLGFPTRDAVPFRAASPFTMTCEERRH